jgi:hypothetical protein
VGAGDLDPGVALGDERGDLLGLGGLVGGVGLAAGEGVVDRREGGDEPGAPVVVVEVADRDQQGQDRAEGGGDELGVDVGRLIAAGELAAARPSRSSQRAVRPAGRGGGWASRPSSTGAAPAGPAGRAGSPRRG